MATIETTFRYEGGTIPPEYKCGKCGAKLWREYQTFSPALLCGPCALVDQCKMGPIDAEGYRQSEDGKTDQIGGVRASGAR